MNTTPYKCNEAEGKSLVLSISLCFLTTKKERKKNLMRKLITFTTLATLLAFPAFAFDGYNARVLNTPAAKEKLLKDTCADTGNNNRAALCERWKAFGVPDSDIRLGIASVAMLAGGVAGGAIVAKPALVGLTGPVKVGVWTPNVIQGAIVAGAVSGTVVYGASKLVK